MELIEYFKSNGDRHAISKWWHYFEIYETHFRKFVGKKVKILEIGISQGGSLEMWREYFGSDAQIVGIDVIPSCVNFESDRIKVYIGDQSDVSFLNSIIEKEGNFDIVIDDGSHRVDHQITSFKTLYDNINDGGIYLCEDLHTSYMEQYKGGYKTPDTFIEFTKNLIDELNAYHINNFQITDFTNNTTGIHIYDSVIVFDKKRREKPTDSNIGIKTI